MGTTTERLEIDAPDGPMTGYLARPDDGQPHRAVVVLMEAFGLTTSIESVCDRLAGEGYVALAPDLFYREAPDNIAHYDDIPRGMALMGELVGRGNAFLFDIEAALDVLDAREDVASGGYGLMGFCMGGGLTFMAACGIQKRFAAFAPFYGGGMVNVLNLAGRIDAPMYLFFAEIDDFIPLEQVREVEAKLAELDKPFELQIYEGAEHGFFNEKRPSVYHPEAAADSWEKLQAFYAEHLPN